MNYEEKSQALVEALPYIQKYHNKTIVIKYGGNAMINDELREAVISDVVLLSLVGINVVMVHGGGPEISAMLKQIGKESRFVNGLRYTDEETMDVVQMVLCGKVNKNLVDLVTRKGGKAVGLCGFDNNLIQAVKLTEDGVDYGLVGDITAVDASILETTMQSGIIPIVSTVAKGMDGNHAYNINADIAAAKIAEAVGAVKLILLTDVRGLLRDVKDESSLISELHLEDIPKLQAEGIISGGMIPKIECCADAVRNGVKRAHILDGRIPHSILIEVLSHAGIGTMIW